MMMFGRSCERIVNVTAICHLVKEKMATFERVDRNQVAHLLWAIFADARACFNAPHDIVGNPPLSSLDWLIGAMKGGTLPATLGTPLQSIFGRVNDAVGGSASQEEEPRCRRGPQPINANLRSRIEAVTAAARRCNPTVSLQVGDVRCAATQSEDCHHATQARQLLRPPVLRKMLILELRLHNSEVDESKIEGVTNKMRLGLDKFVEVNS
jgi:hypothetical protein